MGKQWFGLTKEATLFLPVTLTLTLPVNLSLFLPLTLTLTLLVTPLTPYNWAAMHYTKACQFTTMQSKMGMDIVFTTALHNSWHVHCVVL